MVNNNNHISVQKEAVSKLIESSSLTEDFYLMLILSSVIVCLGLILNNIVIVMGGMLVTPFLSPLLRLSLAIVVADRQVIRGSIFIIIKSIVVIIFVSMATAFLVPKSSADFNLLVNITNTGNLFYLYVSLAAGVAAAYAWARPNLSSILPGVILSVALLPPLVAIGINLVFLEGSLVLGAMRSATANILGVLLSSTIVFSILGFYRIRYHFKKEIKNEIKELKEKKEIKERNSDI